MRMKPSSARKKISRSQARNAALLNQLGTPGLGSLMAGRRLAGTLQLLVFLAGFCLFCAWAGKNLLQYYRMMFQDAPNEPAGVGWMAGAGIALCVLAWCWSLATSFSLLRESTKPIQPLSNSLHHSSL